MNLPSQIKNNSILLVTTPYIQYKQKLIDVLKTTSKSYKVCYVSLNRSYSAISEMLSNNGIAEGNFHFIDCISKTVHKPTPKENVVFADSPNALVDISLHIGEAMKDKCDILVFNSITTLLVYHNAQTTTKFITNLIVKIKELKKKGLFLYMKDQKSDELLKTLSQSSDLILDLSSNL